MSKKYDIAVRKNKKQKKDNGTTLTVKFIMCVCTAVLSLFGFLYVLFNKNKFLVDEQLDLGLFIIPLPAEMIIALLIAIFIVMALSLYFSALAMHEYLRRKNNPSALEKQLELIESQFIEKEKKVYISSKEKMRQLEQMEKDTNERLKRKYGDNK